MDDIDASSRLPLFNNPYYRDALGDFGAFFAISNKIDRVHKNSWIGFQSWRATARNVHISFSCLGNPSSFKCPVLILLVI